MKNKFTKSNTILKVLFYLLPSLLVLNSCTKLEEEVYGRITVGAGGASGVIPTPDLTAAYESINGLINQENWYAFSTHSTDELLGPTRGTDWDDFGTWRKIHLHTWDANHNQVKNAWNGLNSGFYKSTLVAELSQGTTKAEGQFLRGFFGYLILDLYGKIQYTAANSGPDDLPKQLTRSEAYDFVLADLTAAYQGLTLWTPNTKHKATKEAAGFLLAKLILNKAVYKKDPTNPGGPYTFDAADMNQVIQICDAIQATGKFSLTNDYWKNFTSDNADSSKELIFSRGGRENYQGQTGGKINMIWYTAMGSHYNDFFGGWNGFTTTSDFYNSFSAIDRRREAKLDSTWPITGFVAGFRKGQQYKSGKEEVSNIVKDRSGSPLSFTEDVSLYFSSESKGIRTNKFPMNAKYFKDNQWGETNDFPFFRYADVLLMKAEAILRGGTATGGQTALILVNSVRARSGATTLSSVDLPALLAERGRELYLECWRRSDRIRFGVFNDPVIERATKSAPYRVVLPIPTLAIAANPNLTQNFGY
ncbi:MAG: RagB/SusD family nutrient uptake outer membrane protein [Sediminibacterium sp.]|nr:RagB/SusD family nutrient uptake outer membrane protein [Sediminibacterium sp.]